MSKFSYEKDELEIANCQCEWCVHYNSGTRSDVCPKELLDEIISNKVQCPKFEDPNAIDWDNL
ncbi:MAG: hypothetical protein K6A37_04325 [Saccharofermentans sp.]|nr:hypothetical protein [Saccharofermentans sp.]